MERNGNVLLCDFGLSKIQRDGILQYQTTSSVKFNAPWAAPEIIFPSETPDNDSVVKSSDVYSFGSVMLQVSMPAREPSVLTIDRSIFLF